MDGFGSNPFTVFTLITAPAVLTNAAAVMSLTTSNRLARAIDRSRGLIAELGHVSAAETDRVQVARKLEMTRRRALLLVRALAAFQLAFGSFAAATMVALIGAVLAFLELTALSHAALLASTGCVLVAIAAIVTGASVVVRETRLAYAVIRDDASRLLAALSEPPGPQKPDSVPPS